MNFVEIGEQFLDHHGVKGQKWGVRQKSKSSDAERHGAAKKKKTHELSDTELRDLVNRMNMERQVKQLNPSKLTKGHNAAKTILGVTATIGTAVAFANSPAGKAIGKALKKSTSVDVGIVGRTERGARLLG